MSLVNLKKNYNSLVPRKESDKEKGLREEYLSLKRSDFNPPKSKVVETRKNLGQLLLVCQFSICSI